MFVTKIQLYYMAGGRPTKQGLEYFSLDVTIEGDQKIEELEGLFPDNGFTVYIKLLCRLYKEHGYFLVCNQSFVNVFSKRINVNKNSVNDIINECCALGLFNKELYVKYSVLTSKSIQSRFLEMTRRRTYLLFIQDILLLSANDFVNLTYNDKKRFNENVYVGIFDDIKSVFVNNNLINDYKLYTKRVVSFSFLFLIENKENQRQQKNDDDNSELQQQSSFGLLPNPAPERPAGKPVVMPQGFGTFDWEKEKLAVLDEKEWKHRIKTNFQMHEDEVDNALHLFFQYLEGTNDQKTAKLMYKHFYSWLPTRMIKRAAKKSSSGSPHQVNSDDSKFDGMPTSIN